MADIYLGSTDLSSANFYLGSSTVSALYKGSDKVWPAAGPWTPPGTPILYSDANNAPSGTGGVWPDLSGNGYDATANGGMTYTSAGDASYFEYSRSAYSHQWDSGMWTNHNPLSAFTVVAIYSPIFASNDGQKILSWYSAGQWVMQPDFQTTDTGRTYMRDSGGTYKIATATGAWASGTWDTYASIWTGTDLNFYRGTTQIGTVAVTSMFNPGGAASGLWTGEATNRYPYGRLAAVIVYDSAISSGDLATIDSHFSSRYGY